MNLKYTKLKDYNIKNTLTSQKPILELVENIQITKIYCTNLTLYLLFMFEHHSCKPSHTDRADTEVNYVQNETTN
jgi:hypothetical protein